MANENDQQKSEGMTKRVARPLVASAVSGLIAYGIRKSAPKLRELLESIGDGGVPGKEQLGKAKDAVEEKVESAVSTVSEHLPGGIGQSGSSSSPTKALSPREQQRRQRERAKHRRERAQALKT